MKKLLPISVLILVAASAYIWGRIDGWRKESEQNAITSSVSRAMIGVLTARAVRSGNKSEALKWIETDLKTCQTSLRAYQKRIPDKWRVAYVRASAMVNQYQVEFNSLYAPAELERIPS